MRESEMRYRLLWETATDAVFLLDTNSVIRFANPAVETVFGYRPEEVVGQNLTLLLPERARSDHQTTFTQMLTSGVRSNRRHVFETIGLRKDHREELVEIAFNDMELQGERWFVALVRDITERKRAEQELRENEEQFRVAREIQQHLFPKASPQFPGFEIAGATHPAEATGGDYFDYIPMVNGSLGVVVGDVTGHGVGPALLMAETRAYLRVVALNRDVVGEILTRVNLVLAEDVGGERFVTLLLARLDPGTRQLTYVSAGHPPGYVLAPSGAVRMELRRTGVPLGIRPDTHYPTPASVRLAAGELILFLTDGVDEAMSPQQEFFGTERALDVVRRHRDQPAAQIVEELYRAVREFSQGAALQDDFTAIVIKVL